ncbi:YiiD C-terminal domain-containing protein [Dactylosporangium sp. CA-092794]|uniref:YiiD C-terminal domain-containing protein n=1 Tax=Dactylosporangium sp. CA-092794 TaxID=3239929 RepID=UPI003D90302F
MPTTEAARFNAALPSLAPRYHQLGIHVVELSERHVVATVPLEGNVNHFGAMFAGALFGAAELLGGALFTAGFDFATAYPLVQEFTIRFQRPARTDVTARAHLDADTVARLRRELAEAGRTSFTMDAELTDASGEVVAATTAVYQFRTADRSTRT